MLVGKINPTAKFQKQTNPFSQPEVIEANHMSVIGRPYIAGAAKNRFQVVFGNLEVKGKKTRLQELGSSDLELTSEDLATWGTDDTILLTIAAAKLGVAVSDFVEVQYM
jgi:hypothetical protein